jgi:hypothetical protein
MDTLFNKNKKAPGQNGFKYDVRIEFNPNEKKDSGWDEDEDEEEEDNGFGMGDDDDEEEEEEDKFDDLEDDFF